MNVMKSGSRLIYSKIIGILVAGWNIMRAVLGMERKMPDTQALSEATDRLFEAAYNAIAKEREALEGGAHNSNWILVVLFLKMLSHLRVGKALLLERSFCEALLVLRSAFETALIICYLAHCENEIRRYEYHSYLSSLNDLYSERACGVLQDEMLIVEMKQKIVASEYFQEGLFNVTEPDLDNPTVIRGKIRVNFTNIWDMMDVLRVENPRMFEHIKVLAHTFYNYASQLTHSYFLQSCKYFVARKSEIGITGGFRGMAFMIAMTILGFARVGLLIPTEIDNIQDRINAVVSAVQVYDAEEGEEGEDRASQSSSP